VEPQQPTALARHFFKFPAAMSHWLPITVNCSMNTMTLPLHVAARTFALITSLTTSGLLCAETITLQALGDFPSIDAGEVPYYTEDARGTLAINAAIEEYRDKFARATTTYSGAGGTYDLTLNTLGELDGDCEYRVLVNGVVVGTVVNDPVTNDYTEQFHTFADIDVPAGATLAVESNALSNGLIPEGDAYAFARGRWRSLTLQNDDPVVTTVDLQVTSSLQQSTVQSGDSFTLNVDVTNSSSADTATQPVVSIEVPSSISFTLPAQCADTEGAGGALQCELPELAPQQTQSLSLTGTAATAGQVALQASVSADQADDNNANNASSATLTVSEPAAPSTVDLQLHMVSNATAALATGDEVTYTLTITNAHGANVATAPVAGINLPQNLQFQSSADCTADGSNVLCSLAELAPGTQSAVTFTATAVSAGDATLIASASATEADDNTSDNEVVLPVTVVATSPASVPATDPAESPNTDTGGNSGGGSGSLLMLLLLPALARRRCVAAVTHR
jgi:uncharacterized repeat protein (TIGR01451 family)